jgi:hypothetical protein
MLFSFRNGIFLSIFFLAVCALASTPTPGVFSTMYGSAPFSTSTPTTNISGRDKYFQEASDLALKGSVKSHFRKGMRLFLKRKYEKAIPELIASTMIVDPFTWNYWYAEAYATLGVIYQFYVMDEDHLTVAREYYLLALKRDPHTSTASYYLQKIKSQKSSGEDSNSGVKSHERAIK